MTTDKQSTLPVGDLYTVQVGSVTRHLRKTRLTEGIYTPSFVMLGDTWLVEESANLLAQKLRGYQFDAIVGPEAKVLPLLQALAARLGHDRYVVARKSIKAYMRNVLTVEASSITTHGTQTLNLNGIDAAFIKGKKVAVIDDVVATGGSIRALEKLVAMAGGEVSVRAAVMKEGEAFTDPLVHIGFLPIWTS